MGFSPTIAYADDTDVAIIQENQNSSEISPSEVINAGVVTDSAIEVSVPSNLVYEKQEVQLDIIPSDLHVDLPTVVTLETLNDNQYGYTDKIKISCDSDNEYRVELSLKDTNITYVSSDGSTVSGVATIGDSVSYSWSYEDVASGMEIPLSVVVDKPEYTGSYTTALNFSINVYQMQEVEVKTEENASDAKDTEKVEDTNDDEATAPKENTNDEDKDVTSEDDTQVSDNTEAQPSTSEENINEDTSKDDIDEEISKEDTGAEETPDENKDSIQVSDDIEVLPSIDEENTIVNDYSNSPGVADDCS